jgi:Cu2+-exporting ATPase
LKGRGIDPSIQDPLYEKAEALGLFSPAEKEIKEGEELRLAFWIEGLFCPACQHLLEQTVGKMRGVLSITVDYTTDLALVWYQPRYVNQDEIFAAIRSLGYQPHQLEALDGKGWEKNLRWRLGIASFCTLNVMMASYPLLAEELAGDSTWGLFFSLYAFTTALPVPFYAAWPLLKQGFASLIRLRFGLEAFITIGVVGGFSLSLLNVVNGYFALYLDAATFLPTLFLVGKLLEIRVKGEARDRLLEVARALPLRGRKGDHWVPLKEIAAGDELLILRGEKVVLDGEVVEGEALVDESVVTGESLPHLRKLSDKLIAGSRLVDGWVKMRVLSPQAGSTLHTLVSLMEEGIQNRSPFKTPLERLVAIFLPAVLTISILLFFWRGALDALSLLLLACPCTIGIALPLARSRLAALLGKEGIVVRRMEALDLLGCETHLLLDKTGTLTEGEPEVVGGLEGLPEQEKRILKTLVTYSNHPLCRSLKNSLKGISQIPLDDIQEVIGKGMSGGERRLGSRKWFQEFSLPLPLEKDFVELFYQADKIYPFYFQEKLREGMKDWLDTLKDLSIEIVSGDRTDRVEEIAKRLQISHYQGFVTPEQKKERVIALQKQGGKVFFVGDGVNDGPALSNANLSASPEGGQDLTLFVSDLIIRGSFKKMIQARGLAKKARAITSQNLFLSFSYNIFAILYAIFGPGLTPLLSIFIMTLSSVTVITNTYRLRR